MNVIPQKIQDNIKSFMDIIHLAEKLKKEMRHSWLSDGRQESVAEHSWRCIPNGDGSWTSIFRQRI